MKDRRTDFRRERGREREWKKQKEKEIWFFEEQKIKKKKKKNQNLLELEALSNEDKPMFRPKIALAVLMIHISRKLYKESLPEGCETALFSLTKTTSGFPRSGLRGPIRCWPSRIVNQVWVESRLPYRPLTRVYANMKTVIPIFGNFPFRNELGRRSYPSQSFEMPAVSCLLQAWHLQYFAILLQKSNHGVWNTELSDLNKKGEIYYWICMLIICFMGAFHKEIGWAKSTHFGIFQN